MQSYINLLQGFTVLKTAKQLNISPKTVESYLANVKEKLNCTTRAELFDKAFKLGIIDLAKLETDIT